MKQLSSILIANRGEIACRIMRTCRKMGIRSIAVYSDSDRESPFVSEADIAVSLGGNTPAESYLDFDKIIQAAKHTRAEAIHPGYGFLSENAEIAKACVAAGLIFIGPRAEAIAQMGSKAAAKVLMRKAGVPVVPGYDGADQQIATMQMEADKIGYPLLIKAIAGGGGKGMRIVQQAEEFYPAYIAAKTESERAFGDDRVLLEKYFPSVRHIEFQIFGDHHGNAIHLLERECTIQRRYQKVIEESPSPALDADLRSTMATAAVMAANALQYDNAGTVEFILTDTREFYFLEVNTRLQVEHPVTEMITGLDLVEWQIRIAGGEPLPLQQDQIATRGYAIECRLYAEKPEAQFMPDTGRILRWHLPQIEGLRVDAGIAEGSVVSTYYDPLLAKLIVWAPDRQEAHRKMAYALQEMHCLGLETNRQFLLALLQDTAVQAGEYDTHFLNSWDGLTVPNTDQIYRACIAATLFDWQQRQNQRRLLAGLPSGWRIQYSEPQFATFRFKDAAITVFYRAQRGRFAIQIAEQSFSVQLVSHSSCNICFEIDVLQVRAAVVHDDHAHYWVQIDGCDIQLSLAPRLPSATSEKETDGYLAPMPAQVLRVLVTVGETVHTGASLLVLSSMKMENTILATETGLVSEIYVKQGQNIEAKAALLRINPLPLETQVSTPNS